MCGQPQIVVHAKTDFIAERFTELFQAYQIEAVIEKTGLELEEPDAVTP